jgi:hypothetical protein
MMKSFLLGRLKEASTWRGIIMFLTGVGVHLNPGVADGVVAIGLASVGLIGALTPDTKA